jgi:hypothetical protein
MVLWNLLDDGPSHSRPLLGPFESMRDGIPGSIPRHFWLIMESSPISL